MKAITTFLVLCAACRQHREPAAPPAPPPPPAPLRGAAGDHELRVMLADLASAKACDMIRGQFRSLAAPDAPDTITGVLWIRDCTITNDDTRVTFALAGNGWQWADQTQKRAGGTFVVREYVKFAVTATLHGALDVAYDRHHHVVSLWYTPSGAPDVEFRPITGVIVDEKGLWSSVIGGVSSVFGDSPDAQGTRTAEHQGTEQFTQQLASGLTVAIDLCTGYQRFTIGRPPRGQLGPPNPGESRRVPIELHAGGAMVFGPQLAEDGMSVDVDSDGPVDVALACADRAEAAAEAFLRAQPADAAALVRRVIRGHARLHVGPQRCKVALVARSVGPQAVRFDWQRPPGESARATGGRVLRCGR